MLWDLTPVDNGYGLTQQLLNHCRKDVKLRAEAENQLVYVGAGALASEAKLQLISLVIVQALANNPYIFQRSK